MRATTTKLTTTGGSGPAGARRAERGMALMELMLLTVPMCVLSIVFASAIAATATAKNKSMWMASVKAQKATTSPCGFTPAYALPAMADQGKFMGGMQKAREPVGIELALTRVMFTGSKTESHTEQVASFHFDSAADKMFPGRTRQAQNSATFLCNEPNGGNSRRGMLTIPLIGLAEKTAQELY